MLKKEIIRKTEEYVKKTLGGDSSGHDWWHTDRVRKIAKEISKKEGGDLFVIELSSLLHDIADWKFHGGDEKKCSRVARDWLNKLKVDEKSIDKTTYILDNISFKGAGVSSQMNYIEGKIVQDADRLDAIGAVGIARCFATGSKFGREIYNPDVKPFFHKNFKSYKKHNGTSINHFYEKLLLLKDKMNTETAKKMAERRHKFMELFLEEFFEEWKGKR